MPGVEYPHPGGQLRRHIEHGLPVGQQPGGQRPAGAVGAFHGSVASVEPAAGGRGWLRRLGGCVDLEPPVPHVHRSAFAGFRFPPEVITVAVRWYLRYGLSYRDVEELLAERGIEVDHVTVYRWVQRFTPLFADAARPLPACCRGSVVRR